MSDPETISLREYLEGKIDALAQQRVEDKAALEVRLSEHQAAHDREHATQEKNDIKDEAKLEIRLAGMNEIREQLNMQAATFVRADNVDNRFTALQERMEQGDKNLGGRMDTIIGRLDAVDKTLASTSGRSGGSAATVSYIVMGIGALATIISIFFLLSGK